MSEEKLPAFDQPAAPDEPDTPELMDDSAEPETMHETINGHAGYNVIGTKSSPRQGAPKPKSGSVETRVNEALVVARKLAHEGTYLRVNSDGSVSILNKKPRQR